MKLIKLTFIAFILSTIISSLAISIVPSSTRSRKAISKVKPLLIKELEKKNLHWGAPIFIRIFKLSYELELWIRNKEKFDLFQTYKICTYSGKLGPKEKEGDLQAPEGFYFVTPNQMNPISQFHLSFNIGYPNKYDLVYSRTGGLIMVHGNCVSIGCFAMTDRNIEEIYALADAALRNEQKFFRVHIFPFRMTERNMRAYHKSKWFTFWSNLKEGYDYFEKFRVPPNVIVKNKHYLFEKDKIN
ncbi:MAG: murein L,D-transpeptidase family protein [Promethearchaeota archaeon]